jgi:hypothetical protein
MNTSVVIDAAGWVGAAGLLWAYGMISAGKLKAVSRKYQYANLIGSVFLFLNTVYYGAYPSSAVNIIWIGIAGFALFRIYAIDEQKRPEV